MIASNCPVSRSTIRHLRSSGLWVSFILLALVGLVLPNRDGHAALGATGQWTPPQDWSNTNPLTRAVHLVLLPGGGTPQSPHSRVMFWVSANSTTFGGREWAWNSGNEGCGAFPSGNFNEISVPGTDDDLFCSGHVVLPDSRVFIPGGTSPVTGLYGENKARIFTPGAGGTPGSWSNPGNMVEWRWYPVATALRDCRVVITGGNRHPFHRILFGKRNSAAPSSPTCDYLYRFAPVAEGQWDSAEMPDIGPNSDRPKVREGHSFVWTSAFNEVLFGGRDSSGLALNDTYLERLSE